MTLEDLASELGLSEEDLKDPAKVTAAAEALEAENKAAKAGDEMTQEEKVLHDQLGRLEKARAAKAERLAKAEKPKDAPATQETLSELDVENKVYARMEKLSPAKIEILKEFQALPKNKGKSFEEIAQSSAVKAEFKEIQDAVDAATELDINADDDTKLASKNELHEKYVETGKEPETTEELRTVAEKSLEADGFKQY